MNGDAAPRRLLYLLGDLGGGTGNHLLSMLRRFDAARWDASVLTWAPYTARPVDGVAVRRLRRAPKPLDHFPVAQAFHLAGARRAVRELRPSVVHAYFFWAIIYARLLKKAGLIERLVENREDEGFNWGPKEYRLLRWTRGAVDRVVCVSEGVQAVVRRRELLPESKLLVIRNGVEDLAPSFDREAARAGLRAELGIPPDAPLVGMVANYQRAVKGIDDFLAAVPLILRDVPEAWFVVAGGGDREGRLRALRDAGLEARVLLPGYRPDIHRVYAALDVSVLTSRSEGLSLTLLESMVHGLPVVATAV
ncbi:MAG TPA: glycosyltransferase, partial [Acidobacteriota bacterium]|nr:glycosyltransferase [Acidobacteriota bacterium]